MVDRLCFEHSCLLFPTNNFDQPPLPVIRGFSLVKIRTSSTVRRSMVRIVVWSIAIRGPSQLKDFALTVIRRPRCTSIFLTRSSPHGKIFNINSIPSALTQSLLRDNSRSRSCHINQFHKTVSNITILSSLSSS